MLRQVLLLASLLGSACAGAGVTVHIECNKRADFVAVHYVGENQAGGALIASLGSAGIDPWRLVEVQNDRITKESSVREECELSDGTYVVTVGPTPGNMNVQGACGAHMSAWTRISKHDLEIVGTQFEAGDCHDSESSIRTRALWRVGAEEAEFTEVPYDEFW